MHAIGDGASAAACLYECTRALTQFENAGVFEFGVCLDDSVWADDQFFGEGADAGELITVAQDAGFGGVLDLLHELEVEGVAEGGIEFLEEHSVSVCGYSVMEGSIEGKGFVARKERFTTEGTEFAEVKRRRTRAQDAVILRTWGAAVLRPYMIVASGSGRGDAESRHAFCDSFVGFGGNG